MLKLEYIIKDKNMIEIFIQDLQEKDLEKIIEKARELKMEHLFLTSNQKREVARNMYRSFGFEEYKTTPFKLFL